MHDENLKMGKDVQGIERGKCACGECEDFMRSDGATCGYCGCLPTRHSKKGCPLLLTLLVAHRVREQVKVQVQRSGKMKTWGGSRTQRANILNSQIVFCQNSTCPFDHLSIQGSFRRCFVTEWKRQWEVCEALKAINHNLALVTSDNPAAAGRFTELYMEYRRMSLSRAKWPTM